MSGELDKLTGAMLTSYRSDKRTERIGSAFLPSRDAIVEIIGELRQVLFPGYFGQLALTKQNIRYHVGGLLFRLRKQLSEQIYHCLCHTERENASGEPENRETAADMADKFLRRLPAIRKMLALDAQAGYDGDPRRQKYRRGHLLLSGLRRNYDLSPGPRAVGDECPFDAADNGRVRPQRHRR